MVAYSIAAHTAVAQSTAASSTVHGALHVVDDSIGEDEKDGIVLAQHSTAQHNAQDSTGQHSTQNITALWIHMAHSEQHRNRQNKVHL